ncbi:MAG: KR domain-containing protein, partial [Nitrospinae bacterium]|nr:KR domain-containing protein [Nitrospinota bacterium]
EEFWKNLCEGKESFSNVPKSRFDNVSGKINELKGGFLDGIENFDFNFFNIPEESSLLTDPQLRVFLEESWKALEDAAYVGKKSSRFKGTLFCEIDNGDYDRRIQKLGSQNKVNPLEPEGSSLFLPLKEITSTVLNSGKSSSLTAIQLGCQNIQNGESDIVVAGGSFIRTSPEGISEMFDDKCSPDSHCRAFDNKANGIVPGECTVAIVLKSLEAARRDCDHVYGVIKGIGINQGNIGVGKMGGDMLSQSRLALEVYEKAGINPSSISYVEANGLGIKLNDATEIEALSSTFEKFTDKKQFCPIGSVKTNIGYSASVSGFAAIVKALLSLKYKKIPPSLHYKNENKKIQFSKSPFYVNSELADWNPPKGEKRICAVSSFNEHGGNAHVLLEEEIFHQKEEKKKFPLNIIALSAQTPTALAQQWIHLERWLETNKLQHDIGDISYTLLTGRKHFAYRAVMVVKNIDDLCDKVRLLNLGKVPVGYFFNDGKEGEELESLQESSEQDNNRKKFEKLMSKNHEAKQYTKDFMDLSDIYLKGEQIDWENLFLGSGRQTLSMPVYPFEAKRCWIAPAIEEKKNIPSRPRIQQGKNNNFETVYYKPIWETAELPSVIDIEKVKEPDVLPESMLLFDENLEIKKEIEKRWHNHILSKQLFVVLIGTDYKELGHNVYEINPENLEDYHKLLNSIKKMGVVPETTIHAWSRGKFMPAPDDLNFHLKKGAYSTLLLNQAYQTIFGIALPSLLYLFLNENVESRQQPDQPQFASLASVFKLIRKTNPGFLHKSIELPSTFIEGGNLRKVGISLLFNELLDIDLYDVEVRYALEKRFVKRFQEFNPQSTFYLDNGESNNLSFKDSGVYVITGAGSELANNFALYIAEKAKAKIALIGDDAVTPEISELIEQLKEKGTEARFFSADLRGKYETSKLIMNIKLCFDEINGVFSIPMEIGRSRASGKMLENFKERVESTLLGALHLDELTKEENLDFFVLFSSYMSVNGDKEALVNAFISSFQDNFAQMRKDMRMMEKRSGVSLSITWPLWDKFNRVDPFKQILSSDYQLPVMPSSEGLAAWENLIVSKVSQSLVLYGEREHIIAFLKPPEKTMLSRKGIKEPELHWKTERFLKSLIAKVIKTNPDQINPWEEFTEYGFDSITKENYFCVLGIYFKSLPENLLREYSTLEKLTEYFLESHRDELCAVIDIKIPEEEKKEPTPLPTAEETSDKKERLFIFSASDTESLRNSLIEFREFLFNSIQYEDAYNFTLYDLSLTLQSADKDLKERVAIVVKSKEELLEALTNFLDGKAVEQILISGSAIGNKKSKEVMEVEENKPLKDIALLWAYGISINWRKFNENKNYKKVPLSLYQKEIPETEEQIAVEKDSPEIIEEPAVVNKVETGDIAVIGMSGRFPGADNLEQFWNNLLDGIDSTGFVEDERWKSRGVLNVSGENKKQKVFAGLMNNIDEFDPLFFNISPREAELMDPQQRLLLEEIWKAFENAGYSSSSLKNTECNVYVGVGKNNYAEGLSKEGQFPIQGNILTDIGARLSTLLNASVTSVSLEANASSSLSAVHLGCQSIINGECDIAVAGSSFLITSPELCVTGQDSLLISPTGKNKLFDTSADGVVSGEGVGVVLLKSLEKAIKDKDNIYGVIKSSGMNQGKNTGNMLLPDIEMQKKLEKKVLAKRNISFETINYIEVNGSSYKSGDVHELKGLKEVFAEDTKMTGFCALGSVKANVGHLYASSGIVAFIKTLLSLQHKTIPPVINCEQVNPELELNNSPFYINTGARYWVKEEGKTRRALINNFGIGGANCCVVVDGFEGIKNFEEDNSSPKLIPLSAKNLPVLQEYVEQLKTFILTSLQEEMTGEKENKTLENIAYTLQVGRIPLEKRLVIIAHNKQELLEALDEFLKNPDNCGDDQRIFRDVPEKNAGKNYSLLEGESGQLVLEAIMKSRDYKKLASLWCEGMDIPWDRIHHDAVKISLPVYPFAKQRFWLSEQPSEVQPLETPVTKAEESVVTEAEEVSAVNKVEEAPVAKAEESVVTEAEKAPVTQDVVSPAIATENESTFSETLTTPDVAEGLSEQDILKDELMSLISTLLKLPKNEFHEDVPLAKYGFDSFLGHHIIDYLRNHYGIVINEEDFFGLDTTSQIAEFALEKLKGSRERQESFVRRRLSTHIKRKVFSPELTDVFSAQSLIEGNLKETLAMLLDVPISEIKDDSVLVNLGFDSLMGVQMANFLEEEYGVAISIMELFQLSRFSDLLQFINENICNEDTPRKSIKPVAPVVPVKVTSVKPVAPIETVKATKSVKPETPRKSEEPVLHKNLLDEVETENIDDLSEEELDKAFMELKSQLNSSN